MKKIVLIVILITGITTAKHAFGQSYPNTVFDIPDENFRRRFTVELDRGNKMEIAVTSMQDLNYISNIDSILKVFMNELALVKDSVRPNTMWRIIDYNMDAPAVKKLRIVKYKPTGNYYVFVNGKISLLKMQQDTLVIHGKIPASWLRQSGNYKPKNFGKYYFSISFYLNDLDDLSGYRDGRLNEKIKIIQQHYRDPWQQLENGNMQIKNYPEINAQMPRGSTTLEQRLRMEKSVAVQNYKNYFIPSINVMPKYILEEDFIRRELGAGLEAAFSFEKHDSAGTKTHVNLFAVVCYNLLPVTPTRSWLKLYPYVNIAYLVSRSGKVFDKNSFRVALGNFRLGNLTTDIQPALYFNNFFKNVTPSLRIVQRF